MITRLRSRAEPWTYMLMRVVFGFLFAFHGAQKVLGLFGGQRMALTSQFGIAGVLELVGGLLVMAGVAVSPVAFILSGEMAFAYFIAHAPKGVWPIQNGGEFAALYCFAFLFIAMRGRK